MKFDFTTIMDRHGKDAIAVDCLCSIMPTPPKEGFDAIPMWIADMNFATVPCAVEAVCERLKHPAFGYFEPREEYFSSIIDWQRTRNGVEGLSKEHIGYENGVLGGLMSAMSVFCPPKGNVLVHSPTYMGFTSVLTRAGYNMVLSPLVRDENGVWRMDYADMEAKIKEYGIHAVVFCSPHNPTGRVWEREELEKAIALFEKYEVNIISDEIWSDIIMPGYKHIPTQSVNDYAKNHTVALYAPSKTFNLAGLFGSYHIIYNDEMRGKVREASMLSHYNNMNMLSMYAHIGAFSCQGSTWVDELCTVLKGNIDYACDYIENHFDGVSVSKPQGTYMIFIDCEKWLADHNMTLDELLKLGWEVGVAWQDGRHHGGTLHIRINLASPYSMIVEAFDRMDKYVFNKEV
jgi:cystathionine beta-lyase